MFTGLIEDMGVIEKVATRENYIILTIGSALVDDELQIGDSIAVDGACLTVVSIDKKAFVIEASQETRELTIMQKYEKGTPVNLERALRVGDRLGGHFVTGHVDNRGKIDCAEKVGESLVLRIGYDTSFDYLVAGKGSVTVNGISLTINNRGSGWLEVNIIPHTLKNTTLRNISENDEVNIEFDLLARYVTSGREEGVGKKLTMDDLIESGF